MAETLGSLCDKLTVVKLKQFHTEQSSVLQSLDVQKKQLQSEIDGFIAAAVSGNIPLEHLVFASNKIYRKEGNAVADIQGSFGEVFSRLAEINCNLWHEQEKVYEFEKVPSEQKNTVVKNLALLNLERNNCIDRINMQFSDIIQKK
ncbi:MAG: hypothetical protein KKE17_07535 [Proteobacteria bacterium]|nr:hypothetical protein [Pseudomonadota bacterium]MBU1709839.1 hypothetical protein [Pseudomonadota bacterium]